VENIKKAINMKMGLERPEMIKKVKGGKSKSTF
jgi:hypothetical protein